MPTVIELTEAPDPARCCEQLAGLPYRLFLDSATPGTRLGRYSFLTADPVAVVRQQGRADRVARRHGGSCARRRPATCSRSRRATRPASCDAIDGLPPFQGGAAGYLAYDWGRTARASAAAATTISALPDAVLGIYDWVIAWDHARVAGLADLDRHA